VGDWAFEIAGGRAARVLTTTADGSDEVSLVYAETGEEAGGIKAVRLRPASDEEQAAAKTAFAPHWRRRLGLDADATEAACAEAAAAQSDAAAQLLVNENAWREALVVGTLAAEATSGRLGWLTRLMKWGDKEVRLTYADTGEQSGFIKAALLRPARPDERRRVLGLAADATEAACVEVRAAVFRARH
jgi:hypothetical protein